MWCYKMANPNGTEVCSGMIRMCCFSYCFRNEKTSTTCVVFHFTVFIYRKFRIIHIIWVWGFLLGLINPGWITNSWVGLCLEFFCLREDRMDGTEMDIPRFNRKLHENLVIWRLKQNRVSFQYRTRMALLEVTKLRWVAKSCPLCMGEVLRNS